MKPIAGPNQSPFGLSGINILVAKDSSGNIVQNLKIVKQCSGHRFNLQSSDGTVLYNRMQMVASGTDGVLFTTSQTVAQIGAKLGLSQFVLLVSDPSTGLPAGYATKLEKHLTMIGASTGTSPVIAGANLISGSTIALTSITVGASTVSVKIAATSQISLTFVPANATNQNVTYSTSDATKATVSSTGLITGVAAGTCTITVTGANNVTSTVAVTVTVS